MGNAAKLAMYQHHCQGSIFGRNSGNGSTIPHESTDNCSLQDPKILLLSTGELSITQGNMQL